MIVAIRKEEAYWLTEKHEKCADDDCTKDTTHAVVVSFTLEWAPVCDQHLNELVEASVNSGTDRYDLIHHGGS